ncbi:MAG TPA: hypothetical protein VMY77_08200 [Chitinophagaceae bacterium]|nr:hypothetical protein [Chitinophagaceae bacterium]
MEVHHSHHPTHKKKWTEYLLEFFMLFLAVFLGFVAENVRENSVERHREKEYIKSLVQNLKDDTTKLHTVIPSLGRRVLELDSLVKMSRLNFAEPLNLKLITQRAFRVAYYTAFTANTATIAQLKAGNLRLIQKNHAADSILKYDLLNETSKSQWTIFFSHTNAYIERWQDVFDITTILDSSYKNGGLPEMLPPVSSDTEKLRLFFNRAVAYYISCSGYQRMLIYQINYAKKLIAFLKKTYHLENE